jgi:hypothetical protein
MKVRHAPLAEIEGIPVVALEYKYVMKIAASNRSALSINHVRTPFISGPISHAQR